MKNIIVVGGGAAGMMAAAAAAQSDAAVTLLEKNEKLGKKLYITGKGRCNVTNDSDTENLLLNVISNPKFLYSAFYTFDSHMLMQFFEDNGLRLKTERGGRVFPASDKSSDVIKTMEKVLKKRNVKICLNTCVTDIITEAGICKGIKAVCNYNGSDIKGVCHKKKESIVLDADAVIIATGGLSYPSTGSTGDGYRFAIDTGHTIKECRPSLVPINIKEEYVKELQGLSLRNINLQVIKGKKILYDEQGEMLFTHFGISGPLVLSAGCYLVEKDLQYMKILVDLKPALTKEQLDERILRDFSECKNYNFKNSLGKLLPAKMIPIIVKLSGIDADKKVNSITRNERDRLTTLIKGFEMTPISFRDYNEAIITKGGVSVKDINPATMESKKTAGIYFAGEVADVDALTGGYNLQIAWSTGYLAGKSALERSRQT